MSSIYDEYKRKVLQLLNLGVFSALLLTIVHTMLFEGSDIQSFMGQLRGAHFREMTPYSYGRRLQEEKAMAKAEENFDEAQLSDTCIKRNHSEQICPGRAHDCCSCHDELGCTCEGHWRRWGRTKFWTECKDHKEDGIRKCKCTQSMQTAKTVVKTAAGAVAGSSTGTKIGYQVFGALFYWYMFIKKGPKERGTRVQYPTNAMVPFEYLGPLNDNEWKIGPFECCSDCVGSLVSMVLFTPRMATTWWAISLVTTKDPKHAWLWSFLQVLICFPCFPIIGLIRRGKIRDTFKMNPDFGNDLCCWVCCFPLMICQEARLVDAGQGYKQGLCGLKPLHNPSPGPANLIVDGKRMDARGATWNVPSIGAECKGKLLVDASNLFGKDDFGIDCSGSILLLSRGEVSFTQKAVRAAAAGAVAVIIFSDHDKDEKQLLVMPNDPGAPAPKIPAVYVSKAVGTDLIGMLDKGLVTVELQFGIELQNDLMQVELQRALDPDNGKCIKDAFGGFLKEGTQFVPGGTIAGTNIEELMEGLKKHNTFPATCIIAPGGSKTDIPMQEKMK